jgi:hypothetical protein
LQRLPRLKCHSAKSLTSSGGKGDHVTVTSQSPSTVTYLCQNANSRAASRATVAVPPGYISTHPIEA